MLLLKEQGIWMKQLLWIIVAVAVFAACGQSENERKRLSRAERIRLQKEDSAAFKVAVMPTLDCLPLYVARYHGLFDSLKADVRLRRFTAQMDCDTALTGGSVEAGVTDVVRAQRLMGLGVPLSYVSSTDAYWLLIANRNSRIRELKQLYDKMLAMTRFSATDLLADYAVDSAKVKEKRVFRVQINDVMVRLEMLRNNEMDAMFLTEPQATAALIMKNNAIMDSRKLDFRPGAIVVRSDKQGDKNRKKQLEVFKRAYDMACDSINKYGVGHYRKLVSDFCSVDAAVADTIGSTMKFHHMVLPRKTDIERAEKWLEARKTQTYNGHQ